MTAAQPSRPSRQPSPGPGPVSFVAAAAALRTIEQALRDAQHPRAEDRSPQSHDGPHPALASLLLLRQVREQLADWESGLIETAREAGASWADLAGPLGVASRQAAERRYLRLRPGAAGATGEQRVQAVRDRRAADRTVTAWARDNAAALRSLAGQITALTDLPATADAQLGELNRALAHHDAAHLVRPLTDTRPHLRPEHPELADRIEDMTRHTDRLRHDSNQQRNQPPDGS
ncbi:HSP18 transcriptional regulator [Streptomyces sp. RerS4]|uniref:HSP18 transcriptional regulator n=1 Tax=Streptomyces sp. RerS4 TaxID=2942449 RepID=UPI00201C13F3|nr:HSP18 transcriptional regulator [Streptomyces sp. RerS4]UQX03774.1 HSP18 transcriptional regulator [Streptomyces sp. RerS4]